MNKFVSGKTFMAAFVASISFFLLSIRIVSAVNTITPSTNDTNKTNGWAYVDQLSRGVGTTNLQFTSSRAFWSCFEYRVDNEPNTVSGPNPNTSITDGRWKQVCVNNSQSIKTILANEFVDVRMVYGAETDERFDWTRFDVDQPAPEPTPETCTGDQHLDATGLKCVSFSQAGPPVRNDENGGAPSVLGTSTVSGGQVLGANTMAKAGGFEEMLYQAIIGVGGTLTAFGFKNFKKASKKA